MRARGPRHGNYKHGRSGSKLHFVWIEMRQRCQCPTHKRYPLYGARGVRVCPEWEDFESFRSWALQNGYAPGLSLDRIDNDGDYAPSNCRWATQAQQMNNTSRTHYLTYRGETRSIREWADLRGLNYYTLRSRIRIGWPTRKAIETPMRGQR